MSLLSLKSDLHPADLAVDRKFNQHLNFESRILTQTLMKSYIQIRSFSDVEKRCRDVIFNHLKTTFYQICSAGVAAFTLALLFLLPEFILQKFIATNKFREVWIHENKHQPEIPKFLNVCLKCSSTIWSNQPQLNKQYWVNHKYSTKKESKKKAKQKNSENNISVVYLVQFILCNLSAVYLFLISFLKIIHLSFLYCIFNLMINANSWLS